MRRLVYETEIAAPPATVFALLADLSGYETWLPPSTAFHGTRNISDGPVRLGTTYSETDGFGTRNGIVTEFEQPRLLSFSQPMTPHLGWLGRVDVSIRHELAATATGTWLIRTLELGFTGPVRLASGFVARSFDTEVKRILVFLKAHAEALARAGTGSDAR